MLADVRYAFRLIAKNPAFAAVAVLSLALGIGANTAIFTLIDYVMLRALPVRAPEQLAVIARNPEKPSTSFNYPDYVYIRDHNQSYSGVIASNGGGSALAFAVPGEKGTSAEVVAAAHVSGNYFEVLGVGAAIGRVFTPGGQPDRGRAPLRHPRRTTCGSAASAATTTCSAAPSPSTARASPSSASRPADFTASPSAPPATSSCPS